MNEQDIHQHFEAILASMGQHRQEAEFPLPTTEARASTPPCVIDVYIIEQEAEDSYTVESTVDVPRAEQQNSTAEPEPAMPPSQTAHRTRPHWWILASVVLCVLLIGAATSLSLLLSFAPSATVTIVTQSQQLTTTTMLHLVTYGVADPSRSQLAGRELAALTMSQQKTIPTTGTAHQAAQAAQGVVTFYNAAPYLQTVQAGTLLTGADGVQVLINQDATIPAAIMPTEGQVTVSAHAVLTGPQGNIRAGDIYGACCRLDVFVANGAFQGGQDARTYQTVTLQDINGVVTSMTTSLVQSAAAAFQAQVQPTETLVTPASCSAKVTPDHQPGQETVTVTVRMQETCTAATYNTQAFRTLTAQLATQDATRRLGTGYSTTGIQISIIQVTSKAQGIIDLHVKSVGLWAYQYGPEQQQAIKGMVAGMSREKATATLLHFAGVQSVSIELKNGTTVPTDGQQIHVLFVQI